ncbi:MAG: lipase family alpha/beta hydrolase, partial [Candidatus Limnocylindria bacterium]
GREVVALALPGQDNIANARFVRDYIASRTEWTTVDVVGHSMGGLSLRYYLRNLGGTKVQAYVSLGTPQYGVWGACLLPQSNGGQMCPSSSFLTNLNSGDDTRGGFAYATIYSTGDEIVPYSRSKLDGGACHFQVSSIKHDGLLHSPSVVFPLVAASLDDAADNACPSGGTYRS